MIFDTRYKVLACPKGNIAKTLPKMYFCLFSEIESTDSLPNRTSLKLRVSKTVGSDQGSIYEWQISFKVFLEQPSFGIIYAMNVQVKMPVQHLRTSTGCTFHSTLILHHLLYESGLLKPREKKIVKNTRHAIYTWFNVTLAIWSLIYFQVQGFILFKDTHLAITSVHTGPP